MFKTGICIVFGGIINQEAINELASYIRSLADKCHVSEFNFDEANISIDDVPRDVTSLLVTFDGFDNPFFRWKLEEFTGLKLERFPNEKYIYGFVEGI